MRLHAVVTGRVQGVGFRWFVRERATRLDLAGWVRNLADGTVELEAEGDADAIELLKGELARGPEGASVASIDELAAGGAALERPFKIERERR